MGSSCALVIIIVRIFGTTRILREGRFRRKSHRLNSTWYVQGAPAYTSVYPCSLIVLLILEIIMQSFECMTVLFDPIYHRGKLQPVIHSSPEQPRFHFVSASPGLFGCRWSYPAALNFVPGVLELLVYSSFDATFTRPSV